MTKTIFILLAFMGLCKLTYSQYAPAVGQLGSTAISKDSAVIVAWASGVNAQICWQNIADTSLGKANNGIASDVLGIADNTTLSLGDGGQATLSFNQPIYDGPGWDFTVFENGFTDYFLELAFVEVSSDGVNFVRFPAHSLTPLDSQITAFGILNPEKINNLAGKYRGGFGTPFDLGELIGSPNLDIQNITHVRIIDVIGSIDSAYGQLDKEGNFVNDPFSTPFPSSGFDLDAVGIIHQFVGFEEINSSNELINLFPNPTRDIIHFNADFEGQAEIYSQWGTLVCQVEVANGMNSIPVLHLSKGMYFIRLIGNEKSLIGKFILE